MMILDFTPAAVQNNQHIDKSMLVPGNQTSKNKLPVHDF